MGDLISRQEAIDALKGLEFCHYMEFGEYIGEDTREVRLIRAEKARDALQNLPSAQPERKTGRWIEIKRKDVNPLTGRCGVFVGCSECGGAIPTDNVLDYIDESEMEWCPYCGADMRDRQDG